MEKHLLLLICQWAILNLVPVNQALGQSDELFESENLLEVSLTSDLKKLFNDRGENPQYHPALLTVKSHDYTERIPLKVRCRGHFRKLAANCKYPPIKLNFDEEQMEHSQIFRGQDKLKLVTPCRDEKLVVREYLVYKLYNLITAKSFRARLVRLTFQDTTRRKDSDQLFGIILEDEDKMAIRNHEVSIEKEGFKPHQLKRDEFLTMAIFQYMIGNTDWSVQYLQNIKLLAKDSSSLPSAIPYDFDHAGIIRAPYAKPAPELNMTSTLERRYRGFCIEDMSSFNSAFTTFNGLKAAFYAIYAENSMLDERYKKQTLKFLDKFYATINDPDEAKEAFTYPCLKHGTGNVVIRGLKH